MPTLQSVYGQEEAQVILDIQVISHTPEPVEVMKFSVPHWQGRTGKLTPKATELLGAALDYLEEHTTTVIVVMRGRK